MEVEQLTDVEDEPVSVEVARVYAKIDDESDVEEELIPLLLSAAREACEAYTGLSFVPKTFRATVPYVDYASRPQFPHGPNIQIVAVEDADGVDVTEQMFSGTNWYAEYLKGMSVNNTFKEDYCGFGGWGYANPYLEQNYTVTYTAGYAEDKLPAKAKAAILATFMELYQNRGNSIPGQYLAELPSSAKELLAPLRSKVMF